MKDLFMIACISKDRGLGKDGQLIWQIPEDMKFFRTITQGKMVIMGRKTFVSIGHALPGRRNLVLSNQKGNDDNVEWCTRDELDAILRTTPGEKFIIGGASLYEMFLPAAAKIYLTEVDGARPADTWFPDFDRHAWTRKILQTGEYNGVKYEMIEYNKGGTK